MHHFESMNSPCTPWNQTSIRHARSEISESYLVRFMTCKVLEEFYQLQYMGSAEATDFAWFCAQALSAASLAAWPGGSLSSRTWAPLTRWCQIAWERIKIIRFFPSTHQREHSHAALRSFCKEIQAMLPSNAIIFLVSWIRGIPRYSGNHATLWDSMGRFS